jgi:hypothetical protein
MQTHAHAIKAFPEQWLLTLRNSLHTNIQHDDIQTVRGSLGLKAPVLEESTSVPEERILWVPHSLEFHKVNSGYRLSLEKLSQG